MIAVSSFLLLLSALYSNVSFAANTNAGVLLPTPSPSTAPSPSPSSVPSDDLTLPQSICIAGVAAEPDFWHSLSDAIVFFCANPNMTAQQAACLNGLLLHPEHWKPYTIIDGGISGVNGGAYGVWNAFLSFCPHDLSIPKARCIHGLAEAPDFWEPFGRSIELYCSDPNLTAETANCIDGLGQYPARFTPHFEVAIHTYCFKFPPR